MYAKSGPQQSAKCKKTIATSRSKQATRPVPAFTVLSVRANKRNPSKPLQPTTMSGVMQTQKTGGHCKSGADRLKNKKRKLGSLSAFPDDDEKPEATVTCPDGRTDVLNHCLCNFEVYYIPGHPYFMGSNFEWSIQTTGNHQYKFKRYNGFWMFPLVQMTRN